MEIQPYKNMWFTVEDGKLKLYYPNMISIECKITDKGELIINL
jgi:hypothetical protein